MCLAVPSMVIDKDGLIATVDSGGTRLKVSLLLLPEDVQPGDYVLVHAGFAIQKVDKESLEESRRLIEEIVQRIEDEDT